MSVIELTNMEFYAKHGHFDVEGKIGGKFIVNVRLNVDCKAAGISDNLDDAFNYQLAYDVIKKEMAQPSLLIENVCARILNSLCAFTMVDGAWVKISKMNPPLGGQVTSVSIEMNR